MNSNTDTATLSGTSALRRAGDFAELAKPRVVLMVLITTFVGFYLGSEQVPDYLVLAQTLIGTALAAGGTLALNQYMERDTDAVMQRTRRRPLPDGRLQPREAVWFGVAVTVAGSGLSRAYGKSVERLRHRLYHHQLFTLLHAAQTA